MSEPPALRLARAWPHRFTIQYPPSRDYFREHFRAPGLSRPVPASPRQLVYLHVPFCEQRCSYCNFAVETRSSASDRSAYVSALVAQIQALAAALPPEVRIPGIDLGGGTPTSLDPADLERLFEGIRLLLPRLEDAGGLSVETTPRIAAMAQDKLRILRQGGAERISMGLQSSRTAVLESIGRRRQRALEAEALASIRKAGFRRVNVDLIFGLPGQSLEDWRLDLEAALTLGTDAITTYDCLYRGQGRAFQATHHPPAPEHYGRMYDEAFERLSAAGYRAPYGSLTFSRHPGETGTSAYFEARLLDGLPYLGLGNYASSLDGEHWWFAPEDAGSWAKAVMAGAVLPVEEGYRLPAEERMAKYILLSLSFGRLDPTRFHRVFGEDLLSRFGPRLHRAFEEGLLLPGEEGFRIPSGQFRSMPLLRALFYPRGALNWVEGTAGAKANQPRR
nr:radical SAM protein [uncultured Holophaga sp.]